MRSVRSAICTSGEPVSPFLVAYSLTTCCLRSALSDIGDLSSFGMIEGGGSRDVVQPGRTKARRNPPWRLGEVAALYTNSQRLRGGNWRAHTSHYTSSTGRGEIEHAQGMQLALLDPADGNQLAPAGGVGGAGGCHSVAAADQHGLAAQQTGRIIRANDKLRQLLQGGRDGPQERPERRVALRCRRLELRKAHRLGLVEGGDTRAPKRDQVPVAAEHGAHVARKRAHVGALAAAGLEVGRGGIGR